MHNLQRHWAINRRLGRLVDCGQAPLPQIPVNVVVLDGLATSATAILQAAGQQGANICEPPVKVNQ